jgi:hypothetical protein
MAGKRSRASNHKKKTPGGRGEDVEAHQGLEGEGNTAEEEIGAARRSFGGSSGVAALRTKEREGEWCGVKREVVLILYRAEGEREEARKAVCGEVGGGSSTDRPLMAAVAARDRAAPAGARRGCKGPRAHPL